MKLSTKYAFRLKLADDIEPADKDIDLSFSNDIPEGNMGQDIGRAVDELDVVDSGSQDMDSMDRQPVKPEEPPKPTLDDEARETVISLVKKYKADGINDITQIREKLYEKTGYGNSLTILLII
jgi:hypothetical protein